MKILFAILYDFAYNSMDPKIEFADYSGEDIMEKLNDIIFQAEAIIIYDEGKSRKFKKDEDAYFRLLNSWTELTAKALSMPAYGVSLDALTREKMAHGLWVEFVFEKTNYYREMPFDKLLIEVEPHYCGFNLIRHYRGEYSGRCFYLDLQGKNMREFFDFLASDFMHP